MSSSGQLTNESEYEFNNLTPIEVFKYPSQASKIIWEVNYNNILESSSQIIDLIKSNKIKIHTAIYLIDNFSEIRDKDIKLFAELYLKLSNEFSYITKPENKKLAALLHYKGFKFEKFEPKMKEEEILNIYSTESPLYYIAWDKVDDLKNKFPNLDYDLKIDNEIAPLDCSIKYGSELCFIYLKNLGAVYTDDSQKYAVQGGNRNIFMQMIEDGKSFDRVANIALDYHNFEIADYLKSNFRQTFGSIAENMRFGNYDVASYLLSNREDINKINEEECPLSIAIKMNSIEIVTFLVEHGADVNMKLNNWYYDYRNEECLLSIAIKMNSIEIVTFLVEHGADVNMKLNNRRDISNREKECPLSIAIKMNSIEIVTFLVEHGADVNMKLNNWYYNYRDERDYDYREKECPLSIAIKMNSIEIVTFLVEHGADDKHST